MLFKFLLFPPTSCCKTREMHLESQRNYTKCVFILVLQAVILYLILHFLCVAFIKLIAVGNQWFGGNAQWNSSKRSEYHPQCHGSQFYCCCFNCSLALVVLFRFGSLSCPSSFLGVSFLWRVNTFALDLFLTKNRLTRARTVTSVQQYCYKKQA